ncbi:MAG: DNA repair protein RecN [Anaerovoracaceae bacterium]|nr:DNA repair protein RecN [Anaerovoracaceae bacterium]
MITHISIKDFAIIEDVQIDFREGLNIITGETGAGKSIVIEAISLALGARADASFVRTSKDKAVVQMIAELDGEEYIISREVSSTGRNICRINDDIVPLSRVSKLCARIADIHGQYDHQSLLNPENHISLIDTYGRKHIGPAKNRVSEIYAEYSQVSSKLSSLIKGENERNRKRDFMAFELDEISKASLTPGEDIRLEEEIRYLENAEKIYSNLESAYELCSSSETVGEIKNLISDISSYSDELGGLSEEINEIYYRLEDLSREIRMMRDRSDYSQENLNSAIERMEVISALKRKYGGSIEDILAYRDRISEEISMADNSDELKNELSLRKSRLEEDLKQASLALSSLRKKAADELKDKILKELLELNFKDSRMDMVFTEIPYSPEGTDSVEFMISTNRGENLKPLAKIASGGEMSRIMLAFKKIISDYDEIPTMIFDEIDSGISGITASIVAGKMRQIADTHQIICITHLPQIAAAGSYNFRISKHVTGNQTFTSVDPLNDKEKTEEIARLLGGTNITETTIKSARELIESALA